MAEYPRPCSRCRREGLWPFENHGGAGPRYLCTDCTPLFLASLERQAAEEAAFKEHLDSRPTRMIFASPTARDRYKAAWLKRRPTPAPQRVRRVARAPCATEACEYPAHGHCDRCGIHCLTHGPQP